MNIIVNGKKINIQVWYCSEPSKPYRNSIRDGACDYYKSTIHFYSDY